ncbi:hypothetical protein ABT75_05300 [Salmonella enterica subsp. enterica serovar Typhimurium]|nr:hypothetical protein ABT75_05300 [Salmonella enterica subsp. enterica serovar Typhimurium]
MMFNWKTMFVGLLLVSLIVAGRLANHYRNNAITYKYQRDTATHNLKLANETITDMTKGVVAAGSGGMAMFAPQYHIAISNTGPELTPQALKAVYDLGKKAAADFVQQQGRDGGRLSGAYR